MVNSGISVEASITVHSQGRQHHSAIEQGQPYTRGFADNKRFCRRDA